MDSIEENIYLNKKKTNNESIKKNLLPPKLRKLNKYYNNSIQIYKSEKSKEKEFLENIRKHNKDKNYNIDNKLKLLKIILKKHF